MGSAEVIKHLRLVIGSKESVDKDVYSAPELYCGVAQGIVAELSGNARVEWLLAFFNQHPDKLICHIETSQKLNPLAAQQRGVDLTRILFINTNEDLQKVLHRTIESAQYPFIVAPNPNFDERSIQRLHLLCGKAKSTVFLLADKTLSNAWPIALQLDINFNGENFNIEILRLKYGGHT